MAMVVMTSKQPSAQQQGSGNAFRLSRTKALNKPVTWFASSSFSKSSAGSSSSFAVQSNADDTAGSSRGSTSGSPVPNPFVASFKSTFPSSKGKHKLSPSPSPSSKRQDEDFVMISPVLRDSSPLGGAGKVERPGTDSFNSPLPSRFVNSHSTPSARQESRSSTPEQSPTPACGMTNATAKLKLADESPLRRVPGHSRNLRPGSRLSGKSESKRSLLLSVNGITEKSASPLKTFTRPGFSDEEESPHNSSTPYTDETSSRAQPLFSSTRLSASQGSASTSALSNDTMPRLSVSHPLRARAGTLTNCTDRPPTLGERPPTLGQKKAVSLDQLNRNASDADAESLFGSSSHINGHIRKIRPSSTFATPGREGRISNTHEGRAHKRINSADRGGLSSITSNNGAGSMSRSFGAKSLALSLTPNLGRLPDFSHSNSSLSSLSTTNLTPPAISFSPAEPPIFENVKPLQEAFEQENEKTVSRKFKPRDSGVSMGDDESLSRPRVFFPPSSVRKPNLRQARRPAMLKRTSSMGDERDVETPGIDSVCQNGWPAAQVPPFGFLGDSAIGLDLGNKSETKPLMPETPVKKQAFKSGVGHSVSHPTLGSGSLIGDMDMDGPLENSHKVNLSAFQRKSLNMPPPSIKKPQFSAMRRRPGTSELPKLTFTTSSSPAVTEDEQSPTVRFGGSSAQKEFRKSLNLSGVAEGDREQLDVSGQTGSIVSDSEEIDGTPTKIMDVRGVLTADRTHLVTPTPTKINIEEKNSLPSSFNIGAGTNLMPRLSLPVLAPYKPRYNRTLHHRQSQPATGVNQPEEDDIFESRFITLEILGKGAFSTVVKVQEREGDGLWAVKKARGVFDGVRDRLRHLEEVDILKHLSHGPCPHVIRFQDAWEQNRQLYIQTELCLGSLAFFLEEYGRVVERLDEGRVWKCVRELSDGLNHIHSNGVIHFDIKPANILISSTGSLKIGDFGLATRWPRISPTEILEGAGLGIGNGNFAMLGTGKEKLEREGDRVYMAPEMLRGVFVMAADIFSFGLVILEIATNICVPDGGAPWHALRENDLSVVDLSPLSPALCDLITRCMSSDPALRPPIANIVSHPVVQRARNGKDALAPEEKNWLMNVLTGGVFDTAVPVSAPIVDEDAIMSEA
ncbi:hypothetical protein L204_104823 [Cryptococcus depauperatus]